MLQLNYTTTRLKCRTLTRLDYSGFANSVIQDEQIQKYFNFGSSFGEVIDFLYELTNTDCIPVGLFTKSTNQLIGYVNGYAFQKGTLLVEFFILEYYRSCRYITEALNVFFLQCGNQCGIRNFRFEVEPDNVKSISVLEKFGARHSEKDDFEDGKRKFLVYTLAI